MKLLIFSDLHLDTGFQSAGQAVARARRQALRLTLQRICELADEEGVDAILSAGDLYEHERFSPDTTEFLRKTFADAGRRVFLAPGNHDWYGPRSLYRQVEWSQNVHVFSEDRLSPVELDDGISLWGAAHRAPANTDGFLDGFAVDRGGINVALFHGSESSDFRWQDSGKIAHAPFAAAQIEQAGLLHAFVGHFHTPKDGAWHTYPGNPDPLSFGESGDRAAVVAEIGQDGAVTTSRHRVATSKVSDVDVDLSGATHSGEVRERVAAAIAGSEGYVRVTLSGEVGPDVDVQLSDLTSLGSHLAALVPRLGRVAVAYDFVRLAEEPTVRGQFIREVQAADLDDDTRRRVLITGLRALDGRTAELEVH
jgi:DNA repair exonuclease SbcCD nuclease subunit